MDAHGVGVTPQPPAPCTVRVLDRGCGGSGKKTDNPGWGWVTKEVRDWNFHLPLSVHIIRDLLLVLGVVCVIPEIEDCEGQGAG